jgi:hypothetical protein
MIKLPKAVLNFLYRSQIDRRSPAYLLLDRRGILLKSGGHTGGYGLGNLVVGKPIQSQINVLAELLPMTESTFHLEFVKFGNTSADVHMFSSDEGDWVVFLDVSSEGEQARSYQQAIGELRLALEAKDRESQNRSSQKSEPRLQPKMMTQLRTVLLSLEKTTETLRKILVDGSK